MKNFLTADEIKNFKTDGAIVLRKKFDINWIEKLKRGIAKDNNDGGPPRGGEFILAISPEKIAGPDWEKHSDEFFKKMQSMDGVRLPGERRHKNRLDKGPRKINKELIEKIKKLYEK